MTSLLTCIVLGFASGTAALTVTKGRIFQPLRQWVARRLLARRSVFFFGKLAICPFCLSHWLAAAAVAASGARAIDTHHAAVDIIATWLFVVGVAVVTLRVEFPEQRTEVQSGVHTK